MEENDKQEFGKIVAFVAAGFPSATNIDAAAVLTYWTMLNSVPLDIVRETAKRILETDPPLEHFPSCPAWLKLCNEVGREQARRANLNLPRLTTSLDKGFGIEVCCLDCNDTGWQYFSKADDQPLRDWLDISRLGLSGCYVKPCECRPDNPVYKRNHPTDPPKFTRRPKDAQKKTRASTGRPTYPRPVPYEPHDEGSDGE